MRSCFVVAFADVFAVGAVIPAFVFAVVADAAVFAVSVFQLFLFGVVARVPVSGGVVVLCCFVCNLPILKSCVSYLSVAACVVISAVAVFALSVVFAAVAVFAVFADLRVVVASCCSGFSFLLFFPILWYRTCCCCCFCCV